MATSAAMYRTLRTQLRPPPIMRWPRHAPESLLNGATPTSAASLRRSSAPSSGSSAMRVLAVTGPTPGTEVKRSSVSRQAGEARTPLSISTSMSTSSFSKKARWRSIFLARRLPAARRRRLDSMPIISTTCRRLATSSPSIRASCEATGRGCGLIRSANKAMTCASMASVLASFPSARAKSLIWRGLTTARGQTGSGEGRRDLGFEAAGGFEHDQRHIERCEAFDEAFEAFAVARDGKGLVRRQQMHVKTILGHINTGAVRHRASLIHAPSLQRRARSAHATVRAFGQSDASRAMLTRGLHGPEGYRAGLRPSPRRLHAGWQLRDTRGGNPD